LFVVCIIGGATFWYFSVAKDGAENIPDTKESENGLL